MAYKGTNINYLTRCWEHVVGTLILVPYFYILLEEEIGRNLQKVKFVFVCVCIFSIDTYILNN
jgi:hypothetical protein